MICIGKRRAPSQKHLPHKLSPSQTSPSTSLIPTTHHCLISFHSREHKANLTQASPFTSKQPKAIPLPPSILTTEGTSKATNREQSKESHPLPSQGKAKSQALYHHCHFQRQAKHPCHTITDHREIAKEKGRKGVGEDDGAGTTSTGIDH